MTDEETTQQPLRASTRVRALDRPVGTWTVTGGAEGRVTYEWMRGGFFLRQRVELEQYGQQITGLEVIGQLRPFGEEPPRRSTPGSTTARATPSTRYTNWTATPDDLGGRGGVAALLRGSLQTMSTITISASSSAGTRPARRPSTIALLVSGAVAGPLFAAVVAARVFARHGFDLGRHPISLLALGDLGWIQIGNFVVTGLLMIAFSRGVGRVPHEGRGSTWIPRLVAGFGIGLVASGIFVADPENAFPAGTPDGPADAITWHGIAHGVGAALAFDSLIVACILLAPRLKAARHRMRVLTSVVVAAALLVVPAPISVEGISVRLAVAAAIVFGGTTFVAMRLLRSSTDIARHER